MLPVRTGRLALRRLRSGDAPDLRRIVTIPDVGRMLFLFPADLTLEAAEAHIADWAFTGAPPFRLAVEDRAGCLVGTVGVSADDPASIFYFFDPSMKGRGYATEAVGAFVALLRRHFPGLRLVADVFWDNPGSMRVLEKVGFVRCGEGMGGSAARVEPAPIVLYRLGIPDA